jgi:CheY-like chemotaxis protein
MSKTVIDVGQCDLDHGNITRLLTAQFGADVVRAHSHDEAIELTRQHTPALVLINRLLDADRSEGMTVLASLKADGSTANVPVMIVSNFDDAQQAAIAAGAVEGFGKSALDAPATTELLSQYLK